MAARTDGRRGLDSTWYGFLLVAVGTVGLTGLFATYAARLPIERALHRIEVLDQARAALDRPDAAAALEGMRAAMGESAAALLPPSGDMAARIAAERAAAMARFKLQDEVVAQRLRWLVGVITLAGGAFACGIMGLAARSRRIGAEAAER